MIKVNAFCVIPFLFYFIFYKIEMFITTFRRKEKQITLLLFDSEIILFKNVHTKASLIKKISMKKSFQKKN